MELKKAAEWFRKELKDGKCSEKCVQCNANEIALAAIEKQIPKKPEIEQDGNDDFYECPACGSFIGYVYDCKETPYQISYCVGCGQAIDWEEGESDA